MFRAIAYTTVLALLPFFTTTATAQTFTVCPEGCDYDTIQEAIDGVPENATIEIAAGTYVLGSALDPQGKAVIIRGVVDESGVLSTILDGGNFTRVLQCVSEEGPDTVFENLVIQNGRSYRGAGMYNYTSSPTLTNCMFTDNNSFQDGAGMANREASPNLTNCSFTGNKAVGGIGGGMWNTDESSPTLTNCTFTGNESPDGGGGGMYNERGTHSTLDGCTFTNNKSGWAGGGIHNNGSSSSLTNCAFENNSAYSYGGGFYNQNSSSILTDCRFTGNTTRKSGDGDGIWFGGGGGGIYNASGSNSTLAGTILCDNSLAGEATDENQIQNDKSSGYTEAGVNCITAECTYLEGDATPSCLIPYTVCTMGCDYDTIQEAIDDVPEHATIRITEGTYLIGATIDTNGKAVKIIGAVNKSGEPATILDGGGSGPVLQCVNGEGSDTIFRNLVVTGGQQEAGGGMLNIDSSPTLNNCTFTGNYAFGGAGMYNGNSSPTLNNCTFTGNSANLGAGMANVESSPNLNNCSFTGNTMGWGGGGMYNEKSSPILTNCSFTGNGTGEFGGDPISRGGGMWNKDESSPSLTNCSFTGNMAAINGGGMWNEQNSSPILAGTVFCGNTVAEEATDENQIQSDKSSGYTETGLNCISSACDDDDDDDGIPNDCDNCPDWPGNCSEDGRTIYVTDTDQSIQDAIDLVLPGGTVDIVAGSFQITTTIDPKGKAVTLVGAIDEDGTPTTILDGGGFGTVLHCVYGEGPDTIFRNLVITGGDAGEGGGMFNLSSSPTLENCTFTENRSEYGAGMCNDASSPTLSNCTFSGNISYDIGAGMFNDQNSSPILNDCTFSGNLSAGEGAGMTNSLSSPMLTDCSFKDNWTNADGGGMYNFASNPELSNCTFDDNWSLESGGGMCNEENSSPILNDCTFSNNVAVEYGGGMYNEEQSSPILTNCSFTGNTAVYGVGGGMLNGESSPELNNCTFTANSAVAGGGIYNVFGSNPTLAGTILCDNTSGTDDEATDENQILSDKSSGYTETGVNCISAECIYVEDDVTPFCFGSCPADLNADGFVDGKDLGILLGAWSNDVPIADFNQDGTVDSLDLAILMAEWGACTKG